MSQNDFTIANQTFPNTRADINLALQALASTSSGSSAPSTTFANQLFYNTTSNLLQIRNEDNDAFITIAELDQTNDTVEYVKSDSVRTALIEFTDGDDALAIADGGALTVSTSLNFADNIKANFGGGSDLQIFHDGSDSYVKDEGTGRLVVETDGTDISLKAGSDNMLVAAKDGAVTLYHDNAAKLSTATDGITVTGTLTATGNVGIGDTSPSAKLTVHGGTLGVNAGDSQDNIEIFNADVNNSTIYKFENFRHTAGNSHSQSEGRLRRKVDTTNHSYLGLRDAAMTFGYGDNTEHMRLNSAGKLSINTTDANGAISSKETGFNPTNNLNNASLTCAGSYGGGIVMIDASSPVNGSGYCMFVDNGAEDFNIAKGSTSAAASGGVFLDNGATSWSARSDERDKTKLEPITDALNKVKSLRAVTGEYIWEEGTRHPFLIAQDVQAVLPEAVSIANKSAPEEEQRLAISYTDMIPLLTSALQEALEKIESLEARITTLES